MDGHCFGYYSHCSEIVIVIFLIIYFILWWFLCWFSSCQLLLIWYFDGCHHIPDGIHDAIMISQWMAFIFAIISMKLIISKWFFFIFAIFSVIYSVILFIMMISQRFLMILYGHHPIFDMLLDIWWNPVVVVCNYNSLPFICFVGDLIHFDSCKWSIFIYLLQCIHYCH